MRDKPSVEAYALLALAIKHGNFRFAQGLCHARGETIEAELNFDYAQGALRELRERLASEAAPAAPATPLREVLSDEQRSAEREAFVSWASRRFASTWPHLPQHSRSLMLDAWQARALLADSSDERKSLEALETARSGLLWYRDSFPAANSQADDEAMEQIDAAIAALRSRLDGEKT